MESDLIPTAASPLPAARRVLAFAPHPDDEVFGCGGTLRRLADAGASISVVVASDGALGGKIDAGHACALTDERETESRAAAKILGYPAPIFWRLPDRGVRYGEALVAKVLEAMQAEQPDLVFAPALTELHPDHQAIALAAAEALRRLGGERRIAFYEVSAPLLPNTLIDITACEEQKRAAMRCFRSQLAQQPYDERIAALNRYRGYTLGADVKAAEAFFVAMAAELASGLGLTPLFESAQGRRRRLGVAVEGAELPLVSVIVRSMDRPTFAQALTSVAAQTYPNIEVLVVNAKGGRHSPLPDFSGRLVIRLIEKGGPLERSRAANAGLDASRGLYVALLDDDDTLDPDHLSQLVATLRKEGDGVVAYAGVRCMDRSDPERKISRVFGEPFESRAKLLAGNFIPSHAALLPRRLVEDGARFDETLGVYEDWDFWLQISQVARFVYVDRITATYFTGGTSAISPLAFDPDAVHAAARALFAKWKDRITPDELKALGDLYHGCKAELLGTQGEVRRLVDRVRDTEARLNDTQARLDDTRAKLAEQVAEREAETQRLEDQIDGFASELKRKELEVETYLHRLAATEASLAQVYASHSWRLTQPIRAATRMLRRSIRLALRSAYRLYTLLPISVRLQLRPLLRPLSSRVRARYGAVRVTASGGRLPFDYGQALTTAGSATPKSLKFAEQFSPVISIVIVDQGNRDRTLRCLGALGNENGIDACELVVVSADPSELSARLKGVRLERGSGELLDGYARGAALARAPWVLFLSGDGYPLPGMLVESHGLIAQPQDNALVVPKLVSEEGQLVFPMDRAEILDPNLPEVNFNCPADRCPAPAFLIEKSFLGSDEVLRIASRGFMTGLVDSVLKQGGRILYSPYMHAMVPANSLRQDSARWNPDNAESGKRILILDLQTPTPDMDSGSVDAYFQMQILGNLGYGVTFAAVADLAYRPRYTADLQRIGIECLYTPYTTSVLDHLRQFGQRYGHVVLNRLSAAEQFIEHVQRECPNARILFNTVDLHFLREQRQAELAGDHVMARQARSTRRRELGVMRKATVTLVTSEAEEALLRKEAQDVRTYHLPLVMAIGNRRDTPFRQRKDLFFIGGYQHSPNVDAVLHFVADIWPRIRDRLPGVRFHIVGSHPPPEIFALAGPDIVVDGFVPDAAPFFNECRLSAAPLRFGAGLKGKVGRSLGYGCPVVLTPLAAEGMGLTDGRNALIAEDDEKFADAAVRLYEDETLWNALSRESVNFFQAHFSVEAGKARIASIFDAVDA